MIGQKTALNPISGMILEVLSQNFGARRRMRIKVFIFKEFQGARIWTSKFISLHPILAECC